MGGEAGGERPTIPEDLDVSVEAMDAVALRAADSLEDPELLSRGRGEGEVRRLPTRPAWGGAWA